MTAISADTEQTRATRTAWTVWSVLVIVTVAGGVVTDNDGPSDGLIALIVVLGLTKTWLITRYFMEVRGAPRWLQVAVTSWMVILWTALLVLFLRA